MQSWRSVRSELIFQFCNLIFFSIYIWFEFNKLFFKLYFWEKHFSKTDPECIFVSFFYAAYSTAYRQIWAMSKLPECHFPMESFYFAFFSPLLYDRVLMVPDSVCWARAFIIFANQPPGSWALSYFGTVVSIINSCFVCFSPESDLRSNCSKSVLTQRKVHSYFLESICRLQT